MKNIEIVKRQFLESKQSAEQAAQKLTELTRRLNDVQENLPRLQKAVEAARAQRSAVLDRLILSGQVEDLQTDGEFQKAEKALKDAEKAYEDEKLVFDAIGRGIKKIETDLPKLHTQVDLYGRQVWQAVFDVYQSKISDATKDVVKTLVAIGCQIGRPRQFVLDSIFLNPSHPDVQAIQGKLRNEYELND